MIVAMYVSCLSVSKVCTFLFNFVNTHNFEMLFN
jgi:hypothetical protein